MNSSGSTEHLDMHTQPWGRYCFLEMVFGGNFKNPIPRHAEGPDSNRRVGRKRALTCRRWEMGGTSHKVKRLSYAHSLEGRTSSSRLRGTGGPWSLSPGQGGTPRAPSSLHWAEQQPQSSGNSWGEEHPDTHGDFLKTTNGWVGSSSTLGCFSSPLQQDFAVPQQPGLCFLPRAQRQTLPLLSSPPATTLQSATSPTLPGISTSMGVERPPSTSPTPPHSQGSVSLAKLSQGKSSLCLPPQKPQGQQK